MVFRLDFRSFTGVLFWHYQHVLESTENMDDPKTKNRMEVGSANTGARPWGLFGSVPAAEGSCSQPPPLRKE